LDGPDALRLTAVVSEAALHQQIGSPAVLHRQLEHLIEVINSHPGTIDVLIMPYTSPSGAILGGAGFQILDFPGPKVPPLAWHESAVVGEAVLGFELHPAPTDSGRLLWCRLRSAIAAVSE
jgi:hypothetical protein